MFLDKTIETNEPSYLFMRENTRDLKDGDIRISQVTGNNLNRANQFLKDHREYQYQSRIRMKDLNWRKYFLCYVDNVLVCMTGFACHTWGYETRTFSNICDVIHTSYRNTDHLSRMKMMIFSYLSDFGVKEVDIQINSLNVDGLLMNNRLGFQRIKQHDDHVYMRLDLTDY